MIMKDQKKNKSILKGLADLSAGPFYPMHMPGHKRRELVRGLPYCLDITEIEGFDDLHNASGLLKDAMDRAAKLYGAGRTFFLTGGSTCGILAGIGAVAKHGDKVIVARNSHISVFHAAQVLGLRTVFVVPEYNEEFDLIGSMPPLRVEEALRKNPDAAAVVVTSPTYEGVLSDIKAIAALCHERGIPLIVDEAHGAHLTFYGPLPYCEEKRDDASADDEGASCGICENGAIEGRDIFKRNINDIFAGLSGFSALNAGADIVIQSAHKTLPAMTQAAFLHLGKESLADALRVEGQLSIYETSSPSYVIMASLDECVSLMAGEGRELFIGYEEGLAELAERLSRMRKLKACVFKDGGLLGVFEKDPGKVLINGRGAGLSGEALAKILREDYSIETEMSCGFNVLALTSVCDTKEGLRRLSDALLGIDGRAGKGKNTCYGSPADDITEGRRNTYQAYPCSLSAEPTVMSLIPQNGGAAFPEPLYTITQALEADFELMPIQDSGGRIAAEYLYLYPPGIPAIVPGEALTAESLALIKKQEEAGRLVKTRSKGRPGELAVTVCSGI